MQKPIILVILLILAGFNKSARAQYLDSLWTVWNNPELPDSSRLNALYNYAWDGYLDTRPDSAFYFAQLQYDFAQSRGLTYDMARALALQDITWMDRGEYPKALGVKLRLLALEEKLGDSTHISNSLIGIGTIYAQQGDYPRALDYFQRSLKVYEAMGNDNGIAGVLNNIGIIYGRMDDYPKALDYYRRSLKMQERLGNKVSVAGALINIGLILGKQGEDSLALDHLQQGLKICEEIDEKQFMANALTGIGDVYANMGDHAKSLDHFQRSLAIHEEIGSKIGYPGNLTNIGQLYSEQKDYQTAIKWCRKALTVAGEIGSLNRQKEACQCLYDAYRAIGNNNEALNYHERIAALDDSLRSEETVKTLLQMEFDDVIRQDSIHKAEEARRVQASHEMEVSQKDRTRNMLAGGGLVILLLSIGIYRRLRTTRKAKAIIEQEKQRSDNLLLNILPADIAEELKIHGKAEARDFDLVSILFSDFKGFTGISEKMSAKGLVANINECFHAFDDIIQKYQIEKIKTIGDAYMAAGGLPVYSEDSVKNTVLAALEMQEFITKLHREKEARGEHAFEMRVGIHTGPVVAGIVGVKKFQYDIWGDTVNTASRMESNGEIGKVNISADTYEHIKNDPDFTFEDRGKVHAKGKGEVNMYFVSRNKR